MAVATIVATVGSATANSYGTVVEGDQYDDNRPASSGNGWSSGNTTTKKEAVLWATVLMEALFQWENWRVDSTQALKWPRTGMLDRNFNLIADTAIPQELKNAMFEYARLLMEADLAADSDVELQKITSVKAGSVAVSFGVGVVAQHVPDAVVFLLPPDWIASVRGRSSGMLELVRA